MSWQTIGHSCSDVCCCFFNQFAKSNRFYNVGGLKNVKGTVEIFNRLTTVKCLGTVLLYWHSKGYKAAVWNGQTALAIGALL